MKFYGAGKGRWDVWDLAGNVAEWTDSFYCDYDKRKGCDTRYRVHRGGAWTHGLASIAPSWMRLRGEPTNRFSFLGFRCARTIG